MSHSTGYLLVRHCIVRLI